MKKGLILILFLIALSSCASNKSSEKQSIKIGAILVLTGDLSNYGVAMQQGVELAAEEINANGGFNGRPLQVIFEDDGYVARGPVGAVTAAEKLTSEDKVVASLVTAINDGKPAAPTFKRSKIPLVVLWDSNKELDALGEYIFGIGFSTERAGQSMAEFAYQNLSVKKVAAAYDIDDWSKLIHDSFVARFKELGGKVEELGSFSPDEKDYRTLITKLKQKKIQGFYYPILLNGAVLFQQLKELGYDGKIFSGDVIVPEVIQAAGNAAEGVYYTQVFAEDNEKTEHVKALYKQKYKEDPQLLGARVAQEPLRG